MSEKTFKIVNGDLSDGYHTFDELYQHRCMLFVALCLMRRDDVTWKADHYEGWDCLFLETNLGQISYHVPSKDFRGVLEHNFKRDDNHVFDGHTSSDVLKRLGLLIGGLHSIRPIAGDSESGEAHNLTNGSSTLPPATKDLKE